jgi:death-on-curing protein
VPSKREVRVEGGKPEPQWISRVMADAIHVDILRLLGGAHGVRDSALIDSALGRPRNRFAYSQTADIAELAAAYGFGIAKNHGYADGNKRTAYLVMYAFLKVNGYSIDAPEAEVVGLMISVADGNINEKQLAGWLRDHVSRARRKRLPPKGG